MIILINFLFWISNSYQDMCDVRTSRMRICGPGLSVTRGECLRLGCCWKPNNRFAIPDCYHPVVEFTEQVQQESPGNHPEDSQTIIVYDRCVQMRTELECTGFFQGGDRCLWTGEYCVVGNSQKCSLYKEEDQCKGRAYQGKACFWNDYYCAEGDELNCETYTSAHECQKAFHVGFTCIWEVNHEAHAKYSCKEDPRDYRTLNCDDYIFEGDCAGQTQGLKTCKWVNDECVIHGVFDCESLSNERECVKQTCEWSGECINPAGGGAEAEAEAAGGEGGAVDCESIATEETCNSHAECCFSHEEEECLDFAECNGLDQQAKNEPPPSQDGIVYGPYQPYYPNPYQNGYSDPYQGQGYSNPYQNVKSTTSYPYSHSNLYQGSPNVQSQPYPPSGFANPYQNAPNVQPQPYGNPYPNAPNVQPRPYGNPYQTNPPQANAVPPIFNPYQMHYSSPHPTYHPTQATPCCFSHEEEECLEFVDCSHADQKQKNTTPPPNEKVPYGQSQPYQSPYFYQNYPPQGNAVPPIFNPYQNHYSSPHPTYHPTQATPVDCESIPGVETCNSHKECCFSHEEEECLEFVDCSPADQKQKTTTTPSKDKVPHGQSQPYQSPYPNSYQRGYLDPYSNPYGTTPYPYSQSGYPSNVQPQHFSQAGFINPYPSPPNVQPQPFSTGFVNPYQSPPNVQPPPYTYPPPPYTYPPPTTYPPQRNVARLQKSKDALSSQSQLDLSFDSFAFRICVGFLAFCFSCTCAFTLMTRLYNPRKQLSKQLLTNRNIDGNV